MLQLHFLNGRMDRMEDRLARLEDRCQPRRAGWLASRAGWVWPPGTRPNWNSPSPNHPQNLPKAADRSGRKVAVSEPAADQSPGQKAHLFDGVFVADVGRPANSFTYRCKCLKLMRWKVPWYPRFSIAQK